MDAVVIWYPIYLSCHTIFCRQVTLTCGFIAYTILQLFIYAALFLQR